MANFIITVNQNIPQKTNKNPKQKRTILIFSLIRTGRPKWAPKVQTQSNLRKGGSSIRVAVWAGVISSSVKFKLAMI